MPYHGYYTAEMEQAERELDARIDYAYEQGREVEAKTEALEAKTAAKGDAPPSDEDIERIEKFVRGHAQTPEWQKVIERIDRGHLSWREVVEGLAGTAPADSEVTAAFRSLSRVPPASLEKLIDIGVLPGVSEPPAQTSLGKMHRFEHADEEEWFEDSDPLGRDK
ncbi:hypothetical protein [Labedaea rhizosphaerae]|uniref:Uncharacterized protein n=1 Tax=Labedaea rhizosphaerae TaxID=598644 RepID=A0A4V3CZU4_LABRH|nr:hypothetical protein [Labedaea rhizosphaerae]TDQ01071.1 hypothetical protein EV186_102938 [Labedaea rhizosphaerae]